VDDQLNRRDLLAAAAALVAAELGGHMGAAAAERAVQTDVSLHQGRPIFMVNGKPYAKQ